MNDDRPCLFLVHMSEAGRSYNSSEEYAKVSSFEDIDMSLIYTYAHYLNWMFDDRVELIRGEIFKMSPAPAPIHQQLSVHITSLLFNFLVKKPCKVYAAPFDVRFPGKSHADKDIYNVLQPDICVICDPSKIDAKGCLGAPDQVIEILSPGNNKKDLLDKYAIYEEYGVKEYWIVSPTEKTVLKYTLDTEGKYRPSKLFTISEKVYSEALSGFELDLDAIFEGN